MWGLIYNEKEGIKEVGDERNGKRGKKSEGADGGTRCGKSGIVF